MPPAPSLSPEVLAPLAEIEAALARAVEGTDTPTLLRDAMAYATLDGGKRLRPLLAWHACVAAGGEGPESLPACVAVELVHCFSLVHDDLPALDNDDLRRGRPTLHRHAGEAMAILAGDALLTHAFGVLATTAPADRFGPLARELAAACERMIAGQVLDTLGFEGEPDADTMTDQQRLEAVHHGKTGAMLVASLRMGGLCAAVKDGVSEGILDRLTTFGHAVGLMFQVVDDLLDVTQTSEHLGKRSGKDAEAGKLTYPRVLGVDRSRALVRELEADAIEALAPVGDLGDLGANAEPLRALAQYLAVRTR
ncbi:MAG: polyprenyl synthetase family protein [Planctomycetota bacterium]|nr:polyprenyl synthetase family protein [Planctomycetota bacterium]